MIDAYLTESVTWRQAAGADKWGSPLPPVDTAIKAHVDSRTRLVINFQGEQVVSAAKVLMKGKPGHQDNIVIGGTAHIIVAVHEKRVFGVLSHYEVYIQ